MCSGFLETLLNRAAAPAVGDVWHLCGKYLGLFVNLEAWLQLQAAAARPRHDGAAARLRTRGKDPHRVVRFHQKKKKKVQTERREA